MSNIKGEAIVMDVDQVLLDYYSRLREYVNTKYNLSIEGLPVNWGLTEWLGVTESEAYDLIEEFSQTFEFGTLDAFPGADVILHKLLQEGYYLICVTAAGSADITQALRRANLFHRFGDIFEEIHFTELTGSKVDALNDINSRYDVVAFVDDKPANIIDALEHTDIGNVILMKAPHNREFRKKEGNLFDQAFTWYDCKRLIETYIND